jgi:hypothetical protein
MKIYRAANDDYATAGTCFAIEKNDAVAYLDNPGFGGSSLYAADVDVENVLDLTDRRDNWDGLSEALGYEVDPQKYGCHFARIVSDDDLLNELAEKFDWIKFQDDYPENCITICPLSDAAVEQIDESIELI